MAIYMKIPNVTGNVTSQNYKGWIDVSSMHFEVKRNMVFRPNCQNNRTLGEAYYSPLELVKPRDASSNFIMDAISQAKNIPKIEIHCCTTGSTITPYEKYELTNVMFQSQQSFDDNGGMPSERIVMHYTKINRTFISRNEKNQFQSPQSSGFDLEILEAS